jgi:chromosome segregation and condensation protein ScpB
MAEDKTKSLDFEVIEGRIVDGEVIASIVKVDGEEIPLTEEVKKEHVTEKIAESLLEQLKEEKDDTLKQTDLREVEKLINDETVRLQTLKTVVSDTPVTFGEVEEKHSRSQATALSSLEKAGFISVVGEKSGSYQYVPTHLGLNEMYERGAHKDGKRGLEGLLNGEDSEKTEDGQTNLDPFGEAEKAEE